jgi:hypothetical protein
MGFDKRNSPLPFPEIIDEVLEKAESPQNIQGGYKIFFPVTLRDNYEQLILPESSLHIKEKIGNELSGIFSVAISLCTTGREI